MLHVFIVVVRSLWRSCILIVIGLCLSCSAAAAGILTQRLCDCPPPNDGKQSRFTLFQDDCTGKIWSLYVTCDGRTYFNGPVPPCNVVGIGTIDPYPTNFWGMIAIADFATPDGDPGFYLLDVNYNKIHFRNLHDGQELDEAESAWACSNSLH